MKAYVICCNDSVEHVVLDSKGAAKAKMAELKYAHFEANKHYYNTRLEYSEICYWHIHITTCTSPRRSK